jgi:hypothetical protein
LELSYIPHAAVFREHGRRTVARPINTKEPQRQKPTINTRGPQKHKKHKKHKKTLITQKAQDTQKHKKNTKSSTTIQRVQNKKYFTGKTLCL